ncbi:MAG: tetratricopeptide repeat protein [Nitrospira sp.]|nr:tetratricopeptide repeat protein [Nitrospira sp.]
MRKTILHLVLIAITGLIIYSNTLHSPFIFDDRLYILDNTSIQNLSNFISLSDVRYVTSLSFAINYAIGGFDPFGYRVFNISIHILNAVLVYWLLLLTFRTPFFAASGSEARAGKNTNLIALFSGLLFVSHPVQTQAVTYITQRFASLATFFYLLSVVMYIKWRLLSKQQTNRAADQQGERKNYCTSALPFSAALRRMNLLYCSSLLSAIFAMKTKEISFTLPFIIALYEFSFFSRPVHPEIQLSKSKRVLYLLPFLLTLIIIPVSLFGPEWGLYKPALDSGEKLRQLQIQDLTTFSRYDYLLTQFRVIVTYIRLLFFPVNQNLLYDYPVLSSFLNPQVFLSFFFLLFIFGSAVYIFYRSETLAPDSRLIAFGILWFFITASVESSIIPIKHIIFEHRIYLPAVGIIIAFVSGIFYFLRIKFHKSQILLNINHFLLAAIILALSAAAYQRNGIWKDEITLWKDVIKKSPNKVEPHNNLGNVYGIRGRFDEAIQEYLAAIKIQPDNADVVCNLGIAYAKKGQLDIAIQYYLAALKLKPGFVKARYGLGLVYYTQGRFNDAIHEYKTALSFKPDYPEVLYNLGIVYAAQGNLNEAIQLYILAIRLKPYYPEAHNDLGLAYYNQRRLNEAVQEYLFAVKLKTDYAEAHNNLGNAYMNLGVIDNAIFHYQTALKLKPDLAGTHNNLGIAYKQKGLISKAAQEFQTALMLQPDFPQARKNLESLKK